MRNFALLLALTLACDDATMVVVDNAYTDGTEVHDVWWVQTYVADVIASGAESPAYRSVTASDYAYAILDRGGTLVVVRSKAPLSVERSDTLHITIDPSTFDGDCASPGATRLPQAVADLVTQSIFPAPFEGAIYDASSCKTARPSMPDAGAD